LYLRVHDFLDAVDAYREPSEFLNYPSGQLTQFVKITSSNSYLVGRGPNLEIVYSELDEQRVAYNVIVNPVGAKCQFISSMGKSRDRPGSMWTSPTPHAVAPAEGGGKWLIV
jgi:hypothetical protein